MATTAVSTLGTNKLLKRLDYSKHRSFLDQLKISTLSARTVIFEPGNPSRYVYFPIDSIISIVNRMQDGTSVQTALMGNDAMVGVAVALGGSNNTEAAVVQSSGVALRMMADDFSAYFNESPELREVILRYTLTLIHQISQTSVCYRYHCIEQQLCRWILLALDRLPTKTLTVTHEYIANMLGVRREGVTEAAGKLQRTGAIQCQRGKIIVLDRALIEQMSCECYNELTRFALRTTGCTRDGVCRQKIS